MMRRIISLAACAAVSSIYSASVLATPYASAVSESSGVVTFTLNEAADNVTIIRDGVPTSLGALPAGSSTFARSGAAVYQIVVDKNSAAGFMAASGTISVTDGGGVQSFTSSMGTALKLSDDNNINNIFFAPRGVSVNRNPASPYFGRVYVSNSNGGTTTGTAAPIPRTCTEGIYVLNPDGTSALAQGDTALTGGITGWDPLAAGTGPNSPWRCEVGQDGNLYIADFSAVTGTLWRTDANVSNGSGTQVFAGNGSLATGHGRFGSSPLVTGDLSSGSLTVYGIDGDIGNGTGQFNSLTRWDVTALNGSVTGVIQGPTPLINFVRAVTTDLDRASDGKFYMMQNRSVGTESGLAVVAGDGTTVLWRSLTESRKLRGSSTANDILFALQGEKVAPDGRSINFVTTNNTVINLPLIEGIPDLANEHRVVFTGLDATGNGRDLSMDAAGNVYSVSSGQQLLRSFSPGGISQTVYSSNGTFSSVVEPTFSGSGSISNASNWLLGQVANGADAYALFKGSGVSSLTIDSNVQFQRMRFVSGNYSVGGAGSISMGSGTDEPRIIVESGNVAIVAPVVVSKNFGVAAYAGSTLVINNLSYGTSGLNLTKWGNGKATLPAPNVNRIDVQFGTLAVSGGTTVTKELLLNGNATAGFNSSLDLGANKAVIAYDATSPLAAVQAQLKSGYAAGSWNGNGITSSSAQAAAATSIKTAIAVAEGSQIGTTSFGGVTLDGTDLVLLYTTAGDATFDGKTNTEDFNVLAGQFGATGATTYQADFTYDGIVDSADFGVLVGNFGAKITLAPAPTLGAVVPEPTTLALLGLAPVMMLRRRR